MAEIKVAILGAGAIAEEHIRVFSAITNIRVAGICSRTLEKAKKLADIYRIDFSTTSISKLYENTQSDIVIVAIPIPELINVIEDLCAYDWDIFLEKPAGLNYEECQYIDQFSKLHGKRIFVGHNRRFLPSICSVKKHIDEEPLREGKKFISIRDCQDLDFARKLGHPEGLIKNWMFANSIHLIDLFCYFADSEIDYIKVIKKYDVENPKLTLSYLKYKNGDEGLYESVWNAAGVWACSINTPYAFYEMAPLEQAHVKQRGSREVVRLIESNNVFKPGFYEQALSIVSALKEEKSDVVTLEKSLKTMKLIKLLYSQRENEKLFF